MKKLLATTALALTISLSGLAYAHDDGHGEGQFQHQHRVMEEALAKLPKKDAEQFRKTMKEGFAKNKPLFDQMKQSHEELRGIITAKNFDKKAFLAKQEEMDKQRQSLHEDMRANIRQAFADALSQLSQSDRRILADAMQHEREKHHGWDKHDGSTPPAKSGDSD